MIVPEPVGTQPHFGELFVSGGGVTVIASDEMLGDAVRLSAIHETLDRAVRALTIVAARSTGAPEAMDAFAALATALAHARRARDSAATLFASLVATMENYSQAEEENRALLQKETSAAATFAGWVLGFGSSLFSLFAPPGANLALGPDTWRLLLATDDSSLGPDDIEPSPETNAILSDERFVIGLRYLIENSDLAIEAFGGDPAELLRELERQGVSGVAATAAIAVFYGSSAQLFTEGPVKAYKTATEEHLAPTGIAEQGAAIPAQSTSPGGAQVRLDTVHTPGQPDKYILYLAGTGDFSPTPGVDAFDTTSNVNAMAGYPTGSLAGIVQILALEGVTETDELQIWGHSQGGLLGGAVTATKDFNVTSLVTLGAPVGNIALPTDINAVLIENLEDPVPALGGVQHNTGALTVLYDAFAPGEDLPAGLAVPGHQMQTYAKALYAMNNAESPQITEAVEEISAFSEGATTVTSNYYRIDRVSD